MQLNVIGTHDHLTFRHIPIKNLLVMKLVIILLITTGIQVTAKPTNAQKVTLSGKNIPLTQVFKEIRKQTGYQFFYKNEYLLSAKPVNIDVKNVSLKQALDVCFKGQSLTYSILESGIIVVKEKRQAQIDPPPQAILGPIEGTVTDSATGQPLSGVTIQVKGSILGIVTDAQGHFSVGASDSAVLVFSYLGYNKKEVPVNGRTVINVGLMNAATRLDQLVVVGYGTQKKSSLTSAVAEIQGEDINQRTIASAPQALQGLAPGITVRDLGGGPGESDVSIRIRGITTLSGNDPLILVDGIEQSLHDINPNDIQSISVLKDAASTAIYGSRAANGVVLVTTRQAKTGKLIVDLNSYYAIQKAIYNPKQIGMRDYMHLQNDAYQNAGLAAPFPEEEINTWVNSTDRIKYPLINDWINVMFSPAPQQSHTLSIGGGTDNLKTLLSLNYLDQDGIIHNTSSAQKSARLSTEYQVSKRITLSGQFNYRIKDYKKPTYETEAIKYMWASSNLAVPKYPDGTYGLSSDGISPLVQSDLRGVSRFKDNFGLINLKAKINLLDGLDFQTQYGFTVSRFSQLVYSNAYEIRDYNDKDKVLQSVTTNSLQESHNYAEQSTLNNLLTYHTAIGSHSLNALLGYSQISNKSDFLSASRKDFYNNDIQAISQGSLASRDNDGGASDWGLRSYFGRLDYNYREKYFIEVNARYDGSSRFSGKNRYSFFPSFSGAWRVSKESFWHTVLNVVDEFKIRGSWGKAGNQTVGLYSYLETLSALNYTFGGQPSQGLYQSTLSNRGLTWETTTQADFGLDASLWGSKINVTFDYYHKITEGILLSLPIPLTMGLTAPPQNAGSVENRGWETSISYQGKFNDFHFDLGFNLSNVHNRITSLAGTGPYINNEFWVTTVQKEGEPINAFMGYKADGFYQSEDEVKDYPTLFPNVHTGDIKYLDVNDDGVINASDMVPMGSDIPHYTFGLNMNFTYKNFDMNLFFQGVGKVDAMIGEWAGNVAWQSFIMDFQKDYWTPDNLDAKYPRPTAFADNNWVNSDFWILNSAYLKLKNLQIGYTLPSNVTKRFYIDRLRLYVSGSNLFTISQVKKWGFDPEFDTSLRHYPTLSLYTFGINLRF